MDSSGESKQARIEGGQFLFVEMYGELFGIDLSGGLRCRLDLRCNDYPLGMCHVKMDDKHYLIGGLKSDRKEYLDDVYELDTDLCRISGNMIREPKDVLKAAVAGTRIKGPKFVKAFILKDKHYLLHARWRGIRASVETSVPFERLERLDVAAYADAAAPPFSCHEVPTPSYNLSVASSHFIINDKLVLFSDYDREIFTFSPPNDDDSGDGEWSCTGCEDYHDIMDSFLFFNPCVPSFGIFLSDFRIPLPGEDIRVLLTFDGFMVEGKSEPSDVICAYAISTKTYKPKYFQILDQVLSDLIPDYAWLKHYFLEDLGEGDQEGSRRICAIIVATAYDDGFISYLSVSVFDVQLNQHPPDSQHFLKVSLPIKKFVVEIPPVEKCRSSYVFNAFLV